MLRRRLRRFIIGLVGHFVPVPVRTYMLWALGLPPIAGAEDPPTPEQIAEWKRKAELYDPDKKHSDEDLNRVVQDRLARDRKDRPSETEIAEWKEKAERYDEAANASRTELEREQAAREAAEKERDEARKAAEDAQTASQSTARRSKIVEAALKAGAINADEVHDLLSAKDFTVVKKDGDSDTELKVTIGDDGQVTGVEDVVKTFLDERKHLVGKARRPDWDGGPRDPAPDDENDLGQIKDPKAVREAVSKLRG